MLRDFTDRRESEVEAEDCDARLHEAGRPLVPTCLLGGPIDDERCEVAADPAPHRSDVLFGKRSPIAREHAHEQVRDERQRDDIGPIERLRLRTIESPLPDVHRQDKAEREAIDSHWQRADVEMHELIAETTCTQQHEERRRDQRTAQHQERPQNEARRRENQEEIVQGGKR